MTDGVTGSTVATSPGGIVKPLPEAAFVDHGTNAEMRWRAGSHDGHLTPNDEFFVRSHTRTPIVDVATYRLRIFGDALREPRDADAAVELDLPSLLALPTRTIPAVLECTGNGRSLFAEQQGTEAPGTAWKMGGVGMATWRGVPLAAVLDRVGLSADAREVMATGLDDSFWRDGTEYGPVRRPLPIEKALDDCLLAFEMNGEPLPLDHGYPLRLIVPGWVGIASIKWLGSLEVSSRHLESPWNTRWYRMTGGDYTEAEQPLGVSPVRTAFELDWDAVLPARREVALHGRSWSGWAPIDRVEVSVDGGETWRDAALEPDHGGYAWRRWSITFPASEPGAYELLARATDRLGHTQPDDVPFNAEGYFFWAVVRHPVRVG